MDDISLKNIEKQILAFNNDPRVFALRNRYTTKTFLDIMSVARSENRHSAFLAWLLEGNDFAVAPQDHPIVHLLDCIIKRVQDQGIEVPEERRKEDQECKINDFDSLKKIILTRNIKSIQIDEVKTEKVLGNLCLDVSGIPEQDRIDIYIRCSIQTKDNEEYPIEFIIENKVGSTEGGKPSQKSKNYGNISSNYKAKWQTERYYEACCSRKDKPKYSIFIYLTPASNNELKSLYDKTDSCKEKEEEKKPTSPYFIHINYQDVLDNIIEPLLVPEANIADRIRILLEEYILSLSLPAYEQSEDDDENTQQIKNALIMAIPTKEKEQLSDLWANKDNGFSEFLINAINEYNEKNGDGTLKQFCEVNKALIIAILRVATESNPQDKALKEAFKNLIKTKHDYSTFKINGGKENPKGKFFVEIVKWWAKEYNKNNKTIPNPVEVLRRLNLSNKKKDDTIIDEDWYKNLESMKDQGKKGPQERYYKDYIPIGNDNKVNYYLSTEWGMGIRLDRWLNFLGFEPQKFNEAVNSEEFTKEYTQSESKTEGEKLMCDLGIQSITWKKILK